MYVCICTYISFCLILFTLYLPFQVCNRVSVIGSNYRTQEMGCIPGWSRKRAENVQLFPYQLDLHSANFSQSIKRFGLDKPVSNTSFEKNRCISTESPMCGFCSQDDRNYICMGVQVPRCIPMHSYIYYIYIYSTHTMFHKYKPV